MTETRRHRRILLEDDGYVPPPSVFEGRGFSAFGGVDAVLHEEPVPKSKQPGLSVQDVVEQIDPASERDIRNRNSEVFMDDDEPLWISQPPPAEQPSFHDLILGRENTDGAAPRESAALLSGQEHSYYDRLATASLAVSLSGLVTLVGFPVGVLMGHAALRRTRRAGWYQDIMKAERRARNAVMIGYLGLSVLAAAALLIAAGWLLQTPVVPTTPGP